MFSYEIIVTVFVLTCLLYLILQWPLLFALTGLSSMGILFVQ
jgi:hypothetical protein